MNVQLHWTQARREHRKDLQDFVCAEPPPRGVLDKHKRTAGAYWQRDVQGGIRNLKPPMPSSDLLLLGYDSIGLAAVSWSAELDGPGRVKILAAARALRLRGQSVGDALLDQTIDNLAERADAANLDGLVVYGLIHPRNGDSQEMVGRQKFFYAQDDDGFQEWYLTVELA